MRTQRPKTKRNLQIGAAVVGLVILLLWFNRGHDRGKSNRDNEVVVQPQTSSSLTEEESSQWARMRALQETNATLLQLSTNNPAFQQWGKAFMLKTANDHLAKVPLFGLKGPLRADEVEVETHLTGTGAEFYLTTVDHRYSFIYLRGVLTKAVAWDAEMTGLFRDPSGLARLGDHAGEWSKEAAKLAAEELVLAKGMNIQEMGGRPKPIVQPETFELPTTNGSVKSVTVFYTVRWPDARLQNSDALEIRFRRTDSGKWEPTLWFEASTRMGDPETTNVTNLYQRFFASQARRAPRGRE